MLGEAGTGDSVTDLEEMPTLLLDLQHLRRISLQQGHQTPHKHKRKNCMILITASSQAIFPSNEESKLGHLL